MKTMRALVALAAGLMLSACASVETATRNAPLDAPVIQSTDIHFDVQAIRVNVPETLSVSEANSYYPGGDIVWREDPQGDRHAQVKTIFEDAMRLGVDAMGDGNVPVFLDVQVTRFHALTEKARYTVGGVHALQFKYVLRNPETGEAYGEPKFVKADFKAYGGAKAIAAERNGITQKFRITNHLAQVIKTELNSVDGHRAEYLGLIGAINQL